MAIRLATQRWEYVLKEDRDSKDPTIFVVRELTAGQRSELTSMFGRLSVAQKKSPIALTEEMNKIHRDVCDIGIAEVRNVLDADGNPMDLEPVQILDLLRDSNPIRELSEEILRRNRISEEEEKN